MYNVKGDGFVTDAELFEMLKKCVSRAISDDQLRVVRPCTLFTPAPSACVEVDRQHAWRMTRA